MKLDMNSGPLKEKQTLVAVVLIVVIVIAVGGVVYSNFFAGKGVEAPLPPPQNQATADSTGLPPMDAPASAEQPAVDATPVEPAPASQAAASSQALGSEKTLTVFGSVIVTYPEKWGIDMRSGAMSAILTDGKAKFEIHPPNPSASDAKTIADAALETFLPGSKVSGQGATKVAGHDAYQYSTASTKVIGVDSPTRIVIVERVSGGSCGVYKAAFDKMENGLQFK